MPQPGQRLGDFEVIRLLGKGGMGEVYEAQQFDPPRRVALKVLAPHLCENEDVLQRFWREAEALARLDHHGIVPVLTRGRADGIAYYTMRLIRGMSLSDLIKDAAAKQSPAQVTVSDAATPANDADRLTVAQHPAPAADESAELRRPYLEDRSGFVARVGAQVARALEAAHREGVLHRDLKPANLMLDRHGHVYIVDFGLARVLTEVDGSLSGFARGTPWYMSPEQARGGPVDARSDIYSLGVTLYQLTTGGKGPWSASRSDIDAILREVQNGDPAPLRTFAPECPKGWARVIDRAMRFDPSERYQTADEMAADLERIASGEPPAREPFSPAPQALLTPLPGRRRLAGASVVVAGCLVLSLAGFAARALWLASPEKQPVEPSTAREFFPWPDNPLPESRRQRPFGAPLPLQKTELAEPIWFVRLRGSEPYFFAPPKKPRLAVQNFSCADPTILLLDYDARLNWYLFDVRIQPTPRKNIAAAPPPRCESGLVFGYRRNARDPEKRYPFFVVKLEEAAAGQGQSRLLVGACYAEEPRNGNAGNFVAFQAFPPPWGELPLPPLKPGQQDRQFRILARDDEVKITVDTLPPLALDLPRLRAACASQPNLIYPEHLDPRGGVGVWVYDGVGWFSEARVTPLASERTVP